MLMMQRRQILDGTLPPRYAVAVASPSGIADRIVGTITVFYYALLTGRAFTLTTGMVGLQPFEIAYTGKKYLPVK